MTPLDQKVAELGQVTTEVMNVLARYGRVLNETLALFPEPERIRARAAIEGIVAEGGS